MGEETARVSLWRTPGAGWLGGLFVLLSFVLGDRLLATGLPEAARWLAWSALPVLVLGLAIRRNRRGFAAWSPVQRVRATALLLGEGALWSAAFAAPALVLLPQYADYTPRAQTSELLLAGSSARTAISERAASARSLARAGEGVAIPPGAKVTASLVATQGTVAMYGSKHGVLVALFPRLEGEQVLWTCDVYPLKLSPSSCRTDSPPVPPTSADRAIAGTPASHAETLLDLADRLKAEVAAGAKARGTLREAAKGRLLPPGDVLDFGLLDADGAIALYSARRAVFLLLEPALKGDGVEWRCRAWPREAATPRCPHPG